MAICVIGEREQRQIEAAIRKARKRPIPIELLARVAITPRDTVPLSDRPADMSWRDRYPAHEVLIPVGYRACVSFEEQPDGLYIHLSISVERTDPKWMPDVAAVKFIAKAFGVGGEDKVGKTWIEEYEPGRHAVNLIQLVEPSPPAGNA